MPTLDFQTVSPSQRFAAFLGEVTCVTGKMLGSLENYVVGKIEETATGNEALKILVDKVKENGNTISDAFFTLGCLYNFYTSPTLFLCGTGLGALASAAPFPVEFKSLQQGELFGRTSKDHYAASKCMFGLAFLNFYLGRTMIDDMFFSIFSGLLAGNSFYHMFKESVAGKGVSTASDKLAELTDFVLKKLS